MTIEGLPQLRRRLHAIGETKDYLRTAQLKVVAEAKRKVPRKTGNLGRSIQPGYVRDDEALVEVKANYAGFVEYGTGLYGPRHQKIVPKNARALHWKGGGSSKVRLSGRSRTKGGKAIGDDVFAMSVRGRKATPFVQPAVDAVAKDTGIVGEIVKNWNEAA